MHLEEWNPHPNYCTMLLHLVLSCTFHRRDASTCACGTVVPFFILFLTTHSNMEYLLLVFGPDSPQRHIASDAESKPTSVSLRVQRVLAKSDPKRPLLRMVRPKPPARLKWVVATALHIAASHMRLVLCSTRTTRPVTSGSTCGVPRYRLYPVCTQIPAKHWSKPITRTTLSGNSPFHFISFHSPFWETGFVGRVGLVESSSVFRIGILVSGEGVLCGSCHSP